MLVCWILGTHHLRRPLLGVLDQGRAPLRRRLQRDGPWRELRMLLPRRRKRDGLHTQPVPFLPTLRDDGNSSVHP